MKNKILINLYITEIDEEYNVWIPVNEYIGRIIDGIVKSAFELSDVLPSKENFYLINPDNGVVYSNAQLVRDSDIKNAKKVFLI